MGHSFAALQNACGQSQRAGKLGRVCEQEPARNCKGLSHAAVSAHSHAHCHVTTEIPKTQIRKLRSIRLARTGWKGWKGRHRRPAASFLQPCPTSLHIGETVTGTWQTLMSDTTFALSITRVRKIEGTPCQVLVTCFMRCSYLPFALSSLKSACPLRVDRVEGNFVYCAAWPSKPNCNPLMPRVLDQALGCPMQTASSGVGLVGDNSASKPYQVALRLEQVLSLHCVTKPTQLTMPPLPRSKPSKVPFCFVLSCCSRIALLAAMQRFTCSDLVTRAR